MRRASRLTLPVVALACLLVPSLAPGTVTEQRARLPPPQTCADNAVGVWKAHFWVEHMRTWHIFVLEIRRAEGPGSGLVGTIKADLWEAGPGQQEPGPCKGSLRMLVTMQGRGEYDRTNRQIRFGGTSYEIDEIACGSYYGGYNLDQFSGRIDPELQEFQSVNNDGGQLVDQPAVFRRIRCFDPPPPPRVSVEPPPFQPPVTTREQRGCRAG